jgi:hypothetical protein
VLSEAHPGADLALEQGAVARVRPAIVSDGFECTGFIPFFIEAQIHLAHAA